MRKYFCPIAPPSTKNYFLLHLSIDNLLILFIHNNFKQHKSHQVMYYAIFCSSLQLTAWLQNKVGITQPLQFSFDRVCACSNRLLAGETRDTGPRLQTNSGARLSLSAAGPRLYSGLVTCERQPLPLLSLFRTARPSARAQTFCRHRKILSRKNYLRVKLEFFSRSVKDALNIKTFM